MAAAAAPNAFDELFALLRGRRRLFVLTGAGVSTESGIPDYRDERGEWKRTPPIRWQDFVTSETVRQRYWARNYAGWAATRAARPNPAHSALAELERAGRIELLVTQNVDGLHQAAGSREVLDLHGRLDRVECAGCDAAFDRDGFQSELAAVNPDWRATTVELRPDGDADLAEMETASFVVPACRACGGVLKPGFVFFGDSVPKARVERAMTALNAADAMLVAGSSLMVWSGYRFARAAAERSLPLVLVSLGRTRADDLAAARVTGRCGEVLPALVERLLAAETQQGSIS